MAWWTLLSIVVVLLGCTGQAYAGSCPSERIHPPSTIKKGHNVTFSCRKCQDNNVEFHKENMLLGDCSADLNFCGTVNATKYHLSIENMPDTGQDFTVTINNFQPNDCGNYSCRDISDHEISGSATLEYKDFSSVIDGTEPEGDYGNITVTIGCSFPASEISVTWQLLYGDLLHEAISFKPDYITTKNECNGLCNGDHPMKMTYSIIYNPENGTVLKPARLQAVVLHSSFRGENRTWTSNNTYMFKDYSNHQILWYVVGGIIGIVAIAVTVVIVIVICNSKKKKKWTAQDSKDRKYSRPLIERKAKPDAHVSLNVENRQHMQENKKETCRLESMSVTDTRETSFSTVETNGRKEKTGRDVETKETIEKKTLAKIEENTKNGLQDFIEAEITELQNNVLNYDSGEVKPTKQKHCGSCKTRDLTQTHRTYRCKKHICDNLKEIFEEQHQLKKPNWQNSDAKQWCSNDFEITKLFMPNGSKPVDCLENADFKAVMEVFRTCKIMELDDPSILKEVIDLCDRIKKDVKFEEFIRRVEVFLKLLCDPNLKSCEETQVAMGHINKQRNEVIERFAEKETAKDKDSQDKLRISKKIPVDYLITISMECKNGLCSFIRTKMIENQIAALKSTRTQNCLASDAVCNSCDTEDLLPPPLYEYKKCERGLCDNIRDYLISKHASNRPVWSNTDSTKWFSNPWEIAKVFMQDGYEGTKSIIDADLSGVIDILINCTPIFIKLQNKDIAIQAREVSRKHRLSTEKKVTRLDFDEAVTVYVSLLREPCIDSYSKAQTAVKLIVKACPIDAVISP